MKKLLLLALLGFSIAFVGCSSQYRDAQSKDTNFFGIVKSEPASYNISSSKSATIRTSEIVDRKNISGDEVSLFWGLIKLQDY